MNKKSVNHHLPKIVSFVCLCLERVIKSTAHLNFGIFKPRKKLLPCFYGTKLKNFTRKK